MSVRYLLAKKEIPFATFVTELDGHNTNREHLNH